MKWEAILAINNYNIIVKVWSKISFIGCHILGREGIDGELSWRGVSK